MMYLNGEMFETVAKEFKESPIVAKAAAVGIVCFGVGYLLNAVSRTARAFRRV